MCVMVLALNWQTLAGKGFPLTQQLYVKVRGNDFNFPSSFKLKLINFLKSVILHLFAYAICFYSDFSTWLNWMAGA